MTMYVNKDKSHFMICTEITDITIDVSYSFA